MTRKNSKINRYKSISTGEPCNGAQYAAELVCLRRREKENKGSLEHKFWNHSKTKEYQTQIRAAWKIIKKYNEESLIHYLNSPSGKNVFSLGFLHKSGKYVINLRFVVAGVKNSASILKKESKKEKRIIDVPDKIEYKSKPARRKNSLFSKIKGIEDGKKDKEV